MTPKFAGRVLALVVIALLAASLPPRCARAADVVELEPIVVTPIYDYPGDARLAYFAMYLPELGTGILPARPRLVARLADVLFPPSDPNLLPAREIQWLVSDPNIR